MLQKYDYQIHENNFKNVMALACGGCMKLLFYLLYPEKFLLLVKLKLIEWIIYMM